MRDKGEGRQNKNAGESWNEDKRDKEEKGKKDRKRKGEKVRGGGKSMKRNSRD